MWKLLSLRCLKRKWIILAPSLILVRMQLIRGGRGERRGELEMRPNPPINNTKDLFCKTLSLSYCTQQRIFSCFLFLLGFSLAPPSYNTKSESTRFAWKGLFTARKREGLEGEREIPRHNKCEWMNLRKALLNHIWPHFIVTLCLCTRQVVSARCRHSP